MWDYLADRLRTQGAKVAGFPPWGHTRNRERTLDPVSGAWPHASRAPGR